MTATVARLKREEFAQKLSFLVKTGIYKLKVTSKMITSRFVYYATLTWTSTSIRIYIMDGWTENSSILGVCDILGLPRPEYLLNMKIVSQTIKSDLNL